MSIDRLCGYYGLFALEWGGRSWRRFGFDAIAQGLLHPGYSVSKQVDRRNP
jgi:hypothetical protein